MRAGPSLQKPGHGRTNVRDTAANVAGWVGRAVLLVTVLAAPWFLGAVQSHVQVWILWGVLGSLVSTGIYLAFHRRRGGPAVYSLAFFPLLLGIGLGLLQLIPVSQGLLRQLTPKGAAIAEEFLPEAGSTEERTASEFQLESDSGRRCLSVYPAATRQSLALLILAATVFFLASVLFVRSNTHLWLLGLIAANGAAIGFFGLAQKLTWNGQIYWNIVLTNGGGPFGPFINRNNGGGYLVLCLAAAIGLALWCLGGFFTEWDRTAEAHQKTREGVTSRVRLRVLSGLAELNARTLSWLTVTGLLVAAVCCTLSRGSILAMLAAVLVTAVFISLSQRRGLAIVWPLGIMAIGLFVIGWVGLSDEIGARLATLFDEKVIERGRWPHWQDGLKAAADYLRTGSGFGTYRFVYAQYQEQLVESWYRYAENAYLQVLVESGVVGLVVFLSGLAMLAASVWRLFVRGGNLGALAFAVTGCFALAGQVVAAIFDFGMFIPANFLLFALLGGAFAGSAAELQLPQRNGGAWKSTVNRGATILTACGLVAGCCWSILEIGTIVPVEKALRDVRLAGRLQDLSVSQLAEHISELERASQSRPDDTELHRRLAELWMQVYQLETVEELRTKTSFEADDPRLSQLASPLLIHQRAWLYTRMKMPDELAALRRSATVSANLNPALEHLIASRHACPLLPEVHCGIAQLCGLVAPISQDEIHIRRTRRLAPSNPDMLYICGLLDYQAGRIPAAYASWKASLTLSPRYLTPVLQIAAAGLADADVVKGLLPDSPALLVRLARDEYVEPDLESIRQQLLQRAESLLPDCDLPEAERFSLQGSIQAMQGAYPEAIESYSAAVRLRSYEVDWRYELARLLQQQGLLEEAHEHAQRCARLAPREAKYRELLKEINYTRLVQGSGVRGS